MVIHIIHKERKINFLKFANVHDLWGAVTARNPLSKAVIIVIIHYIIIQKKANSNENAQKRLAGIILGIDAVTQILTY